MSRKQDDAKQDDAGPRAFVVLSPVRLDGKLYSVGSEIRPDDETAAELRVLGVIDDPPPPVPETSSEPVTGQEPAS